MNEILERLPRALAAASSAICVGDWLQCIEYPYRKLAIGGGGPVIKQAPPSAAAAPPPQPALRYSFYTILEGALPVLDELTTLYEPAMRRQAVEHLRESLVAFIASTEIAGVFGADKTNEILRLLSGPPRYVDIQKDSASAIQPLFGLAEFLSFFLDREVALGDRRFRWAGAGAGAAEPELLEIRPAPAVARR